MNPARIAKFLTALAGACSQLVALGLLTGPAQGVVTAVIGLLTAAAVFMVPNSVAGEPAVDVPGGEDGRRHQDEDDQDTALNS